MKKIAVITGADSGLGREYTRLIVEESDVDEIWALAKNAGPAAAAGSGFRRPDRSG